MSTSLRSVIKKSDYFYLAIVVAACIKVTFESYSFVQLNLADESYYLFKGIDFNFNLFFQDGFVYFLWLKILSLICPDPLMLYSFNYALLVSICPVLIYVFSRLVGQKPFLSALFAIFLLVTTLNVNTWPYVTRFAAALIILTMIAIFSLNSKRGKYLAALGGQFLLVYVRPEFLLSFVIFLLSSGGYLFVKFIRTSQKKWGFLMGLPIVLLLFVTVIKNPSSNQRSIMAFGQHYAVNLQKRDNLKLNPWTSWKRIMKEKFGTNDSLLKAVKNNPAELFSHVKTNINQFLPVFFYQLYPFNSPKDSWIVNKVNALLILSLFGVAAYWFILGIVRRRRTEGSVIPTNIDTRFFYFLSSLLMVPPIISLLIIYPRTHYMFLLFILLYMLIIYHFPSTIPGWLRMNLPELYPSFVQFVIILLVIYYLPWTVSGNTGVKPHDYIPSLTNMTRILSIKRIRANTDVNLLSSLFQNSYNKKYFTRFVTYGSNRKFNLLNPENDNIDEFIEQNNINMIYVNPGFIKAGFRPDRYQTSDGWEIAGIIIALASRDKEYVLVKNEN